jgi:hypothetical protein
VAVARSNRTETYPRDQRGYQAGPDLITALGVYGTGVELAMLASEPSFTLGREEMCELRYDHKHLAGMHARIDRILSSSRASLRVTDISSGKNDIVPNGEVAEREFVMGAGDWFEIGNCRYYAMSDEMRAARSTAMDVLGIGEHEAIDDLLIASVQDSSRHILFIGEPGCDQQRLGEVIHHISHRRHKRFQPIGKDPTLDSETRQKLIDAEHGTLFVPVFQKGRLDQRFVSAAIKPEAAIRLIICATSADKIAASFPAQTLQHAKQIKFRPLRERIAEIPQLLDKRLVVRRSMVRFAELRPGDQASLLAHEWPDNLQELRQAADRFAELAHYKTRYQAAKFSTLPESTLRRWTKRLKLALRFPLIPSKDKNDK